MSISSARAPAASGWVSSNGSFFNTNWLTLSNETDPGEDSDLYQDQTGAWGYNLLAVTSRPATNQSDVWRIGGPTNYTLLASNLPVANMEGLLTVPLDTNYGPWAGKLIVGNEITNTLYSIDTNGMVETWNLGVPGFGIGGQTFLIVPTNQDFYCQDSIWPPGQSYIRKVPPAFFPSQPGYILILQCAELGQSYFVTKNAAWLVHWNGTVFETWCLILSDLTEGPLDLPDDFDYVEKGVFAPIVIPPGP